jgi:hypothetical protein
LPTPNTALQRTRLRAPLSLKTLAAHSFRGFFLAVIAAPALLATSEEASPSLKVSALAGRNIRVSVRNPGPKAIVLISPEAPARTESAAQCSVTLSSEVKETPGLFFFGFTPTLIRLGPGKSWARTLAIPSNELSQCKQLTASVRLAYLLGDELPKGKLTHSYAMRHQRVLVSEEFLL